QLGGGFLQSFGINITNPRHLEPGICVERRSMVHAALAHAHDENGVLGGGCQVIRLSGVGFVSARWTRAGTSQRDVPTMMSLPIRVIGLFPSVVRVPFFHF